MLINNKAKIFLSKLLYYLFILYIDILHIYFIYKWLKSKVTENALDQSQGSEKKMKVNFLKSQFKND